MKDLAPSQPGPTLYDPRFEHDGCGIGFVARTSGEPGHDVLERALEALRNLAHRGAVAADGRTGDGAGVLTQLPHALFAREMAALGLDVPPPGDLAVGMMFFPRDQALTERCRSAVEDSLAPLGLPLLGWRPVPVDESALGERAFATRPHIEQVLVARPPMVGTGEPFERLLYLARKDIESRARREGLDGFYVPSLSSRTILYKGLFVAAQLPLFYRDLRDPDYRTALVVFHQRYSTNTFPTWERAQPFRLMCHNGEINTLQGNVNWMRAREAELASPLFEALADKTSEVSETSEVWQVLTPVVDPRGSDSAMLDNVLELLVRGGRDIRHALMMLIPEAWEKIPDLDENLRAFYQYHACLTEPWDGPAAVSFTDGTIVGTALDRNGLRPARYLVTDDGLVISASEVGAVEVSEPRIIRKGRLGPGQMIAVDTARGRVWGNDEIKDCFARRRPYRQWVSSEICTPSAVGEWQIADSRWQIADSCKRIAIDHAYRVAMQYDRTPSVVSHRRPATSHRPSAISYQAVFGYTSEELTVIIRPMVEDGKEPVGSMGDDTPYAVLSEMPRPLYHYFKQRFAQVTNPPIDPLREELVMSLTMLLGPRCNILDETPEQARQLALPSPILRDEELQVLRELDVPEFASADLSLLFPMADGSEGLERALDDLCQAAGEAVRRGKNILILSDRGVNAALAPIPALLAVGAVHHYLIRERLRTRASLVVESGEPREVHHFACLIGYGAEAVNPYLALETVREMVEAGQLRFSDLTAEEAVANYIKAVEKGLLKIMSKMGISTLDSYCGAQLFEIVGLGSEVVDRCFADTPSRLGGIGFDCIAETVLTHHRRAGAVPESNSGTARKNGDLWLESPGFYKFKRHGEFHAFNPAMIKALHVAVRTPLALDGNFRQAYEQYRAYADTINGAAPTEPRHLLRFANGRRPVPVDEVEPAEDIMARFSTAAMSHGSLSAEAHETLAMAMNALGGMSNSGEGGEHPSRFGTIRNSKVKQVASGRFGVTPAYLASADELQIKMAQGSKPGEGGHLPGHKVTAEIAAIRHTTPGMPLISPPPHHDIYSIEDLAQLIFDLKQVNPRARISVKLVAEAGVGTIAAGVAKGGADVILISGGSGGTGASPLSSIKNAGVSWELGLAETQQTLVINDLRGRVRLRADGGMRTGRDVLIAAILGADEFSFGTAALVAEGCVMARACHRGACPVGIATQRRELRDRFDGTPEMVQVFFRCVAEEMRQGLAGLGIRSLEEVIGRTDLLEQVATGNPHCDVLDLTPLLADPCSEGGRPRRNMQSRNCVLARAELGDRLAQDVLQALDSPPPGGPPIQLAYPIRNTDRTVGAKLAGEIAVRFGDDGLPAGTIVATFRGSAGQSFGAFCANGMRLTLIGEANDYVGKGMAGGEIVIRPPEEAGYVWHESVLLGNTVLYGATGGTLFAAGRAGERFAVRNSGARAVVEGIGDHGCEYMTGGLVVVLGPTGRNFGAGMTSGVAYVLDEDGGFASRYNPQLVAIERVTAPHDAQELQALIYQHGEKTNSPCAWQVLARWRHYIQHFWKVAPRGPDQATSDRVAVATIPGQAELRKDLLFSFQETEFLA